MDSQDSFAELNRSYGIPGLAQVVAGNGGLPKVVVTTPRATGEMYLHGAHVTSWHPAGGEESFYVSPRSLWRDGKAIRGGVPVCFPWFGDKADDPSAPAHGFVRTRSWKLESIVEEPDRLVVTMEIATADYTGRWWPQDFRLQCRANFGADLTIELLVTNTGKSAFSFEEALHAYFLVDSAEDVAIRGLDATSFLDKTDHRAQKTSYGAFRFTRETDSIFLNTQREIELDDSSRGRLLKIRKQNSLTTVVWNPWAEKSAAMADLGPNEWTRFVCVEASNVIPLSVTLQPGEMHSMSVAISSTVR